MLGIRKKNSSWIIVSFQISGVQPQTIAMAKAIVKMIDVNAWKIGKSKMIAQVNYKSISVSDFTIFFSCECFCRDKLGERKILYLRLKVKLILITTSFQNFLAKIMEIAMEKAIAWIVHVPAVQDGVVKIAQVSYCH